MKTLNWIVACAFALATPALLADEEAVADDAAAAESADGGDFKSGDELAVSGSRITKFFHTLPVCTVFEGSAEVLVPGKGTEWVAIEAGRHYPLGTAYRTVGPDSRLKVNFGRDVFVSLLGEASFGTRVLPLGATNRVVELRSGKLEVRLPRNAPTGIFSVAAPGFEVTDITGDSRYLYTPQNDGSEAAIRCISGNLSIKGRHFFIPKMLAANEIKIKNSQDCLFTAIYGYKGDVMTLLDQGVHLERDFDTNRDKEVRKPFEWKLSPKTAVRIQRMKPALGERLSVAMMTFNSKGTLQNRYVFSEGRGEFSYGELAPEAIAKREAAAKKRGLQAASGQVVAKPAEGGEQGETPAEQTGDSVE